MERYRYIATGQLQSSGPGFLPPSHRRIQPRRYMEWHRDIRSLCDRAGILANSVVSSFVGGGVRPWDRGAAASPHVPSDATNERPFPGTARGADTHRTRAA